VERRLDRFVKRRVEIGLCGMAFMLNWGESRECRCVPCHAESIDIEQAVAGCDFGFGGSFGVNAWVVGEEFGEIVLMDLLAEGMSWCWGFVRLLGVGLGDGVRRLTDENVFQEAGLRVGDVCKPTTHNCVSRSIT